MISSILPAILPTVGKLVDKIFPDEEANKREKLKIEQELLKQLQSVDLAHMEVAQKLGMVVTANTFICFSGKRCVDTLQTLLFEIKLMFKGANVLQSYIYILCPGSELFD